MFSVETQVSIEIANSHTLVNIQFWQKEGRGKLYLYVFCQDQYFILATFLTPGCWEKEGTRLQLS